MTLGVFPVSTEQEISGGKISAVLDEDVLIGALHEYRRCSEDQARGIIAAYLALAAREEDHIKDMAQEISGAEREALKKAFDGWTPLTPPPMADLAWIAARDFYEKRHVEQQAKVLEVEFEQRQRADMAEEREKKLRKALEYYANKKYPKHEADAGSYAVKALEHIS
jgi:hypothetical protein